MQVLFLLAALSQPIPEAPGITNPVPCLVEKDSMQCKASLAEPIECVEVVKPDGDVPGIWVCKGKPEGVLI